MKVVLLNYGCKLNFSEGFFLTNEIYKEGFEVVNTIQEANFFVLNTCSVTHKADKESHYVIRKIKKLYPDSKIIVIGCYAQLKKKQLQQEENIDLVLGADEKFKLANYIKSFELLQHEAEQSAHCNIDSKLGFYPSYSKGYRTRAFVKIQDGCNYKCSFCTIPLARGRSRSHPMQKTMEYIQKVLSEGFKEIILTGINLGDYGIVNESERIRENTLFDLMKAIENVDTDCRFRLSSIEPNLLTEQMVAFVKQSKKFVNHFHIPLQSGSDKILKLMRRRYNTQTYRKLIKYIHYHMPDCAIGIDVIVGFPQEEDKDFLDTMHFLESIPFSYLHVFTYSDRSRTLATIMPDKISEQTKKHRSRILRDMSEQKRKNFYQKHEGEVRPVLFETKTRNTITGYTDNYIKITKNINEIGEYDMSQFVDCEI